MNADLAFARPVTVHSGIVAEPLYFPADAKPLFGWLHWPAVEHGSDIGVVICKPFGYEALCAHRSLRALAQWPPRVVRTEHRSTRARMRCAKRSD